LRFSPTITIINATEMHFAPYLPEDEKKKKFTFKKKLILFFLPWTVTSVFSFKFTVFGERKKKQIPRAKIKEKN
jgi:hypothetical protein